jgi:hypothetical protein
MLTEHKRGASLLIIAKVERSRPLADYPSFLEFPSDVHGGFLLGWPSKR